MDIDGDEIDDLISCGYTGEVFVFKGAGNGEFKKRELLFTFSGDNSIVAEPVDWNNDGLIDLVISFRTSRLPVVFINKGTKINPIFDGHINAGLEACVYLYEPMNENRNSTPSEAFPFDMDNDGYFDLVCGDEHGNIYWYNNTGKSKTEPKFAKPVMIFTNRFDYKFYGEETPMGGRLKIALLRNKIKNTVELFAGDTYNCFKPTRKLSKVEVLKFKELKSELSDLYRESIKAWKSGDKVKKETISKKIDILDKQINELNYYNYWGTGYLWKVTMNVDNKNNKQEDSINASKGELNKQNSGVCDT